MNSAFTRRTFLQTGAAGVLTTAVLADEKKLPPIERVRVGVVGLAGQGQYNWSSLASAGADVVAICDVDDSRTEAARKKFPNAKFYTDYRKLLEAKGLDALLCATPDHTHFHITSAAIEAGLHVYCEKPLCHTIFEVRKLRELVKKHKRISQMGTQIHAGDNYRRVVEMVKAGVIGNVKEAHVWVGGAWNGNGKRPDAKPVPKTLDWDLWQGPVVERPYAPEYVPFHWRRYWAYGGGRMADMACHHMDLVFWALELGAPSKVVAQGSPFNSETCADWITAEYDFAAVGKKPPVKVFWYDGDKRPKQLTELKQEKWGDGTLFIGDKGMILANYGKRLVLPEDKFKGVDGDKSIPNSIGHHKEWLEAIRTNGPTTCNFEYSGNLTEAVLLGVIAYRVGKPLEWDSANLKCKGTPEADALITKEYRKGWEVK